MSYQFVQEGEDVFKYGDQGDLYYIILSGTVAVKIPQNYRKSTLFNIA